MEEKTRYSTVRRALEPLRDDGATRVPDFRVLRPYKAEDAFRDAQRRMATLARGEARRGVFVFAQHVDHGNVGHLWLEATAAPRAGVLGRHHAVDLSLPVNDALSLRHVLVVVRLVEGRVRTSLVDLASSVGLSVEAVGEVRRVDVEGPLAATSLSFGLFVVPTGEPLPWEPRARDAWAQFCAAPRTVMVPKGLPGLEVGQVRSRFGRVRGCRRVTEAELARGLLIGRDGRCDVQVPDDCVSRVHCVALSLDGVLSVADAGSTNGTIREGGVEIGWAPWGDGEVLHLGARAVVEWRGPSMRA
jgi:hypothetical protein